MYAVWGDKGVMPKVQKLHFLLRVRGLIFLSGKVITYNLIYRQQVLTFLAHSVKFPILYD